MIYIIIIILLLLLFLNNNKEHFYYEKNIKATHHLPLPVSPYPKETAQSFYERKFNIPKNHQLSFI